MGLGSDNLFCPNGCLREFASANERHPWDVRGKVGSERKFATSERFAKIRCRRDRSLTIALVPAGGPKILSTDRRICK